MPRAPASPLASFPVLRTRHLAAAREATGRFWPKHSSTVLGPDGYSLELNRVMLGQVALTFVACTSRIRVVSQAPATDYTLYCPLTGSIEVVADGVDMTATADRPLLRGPARTFVFEPSPIKCLIVDIPGDALANAAADAPLRRHVSIAAPGATSVSRLACRLATAAGRSRALVALQRLTTRDRLACLPTGIRRIEEQIIALAAQATAEPPGEGGACDVAALKAWLASHAHRRVRIGELAARTGVATRTVERAFLRTGCTPGEYLKRTRLDRARRILAGPTGDLTIAEVAAAVGYTHLGRFAGEYRDRFGELPSRTLARHRPSGR